MPTQMTPAEQYASFAELARRYCDLIEDDSIRGPQSLQLIERHLLAVYMAATQLPEGNVAEANAASPDLSDHWWRLFRSLPERLDCDVYWDTFDPTTEPPEEVVASSLADDLCDVWRDLKRGLLTQESDRGFNPENVWWEWRFSFWAHWGYHAIRALRFLHYKLRETT